MRPNRLVAPALFTLLLFMSSCGEEIYIEREGSGILTGTLFAAQDNCDSLPATGATISLEGADIVATVNSSGFWSMPRVPTGRNKTISFKWKGLERKLTSIRIRDEDSLHIQMNPLYPISNFTADSVSVVQLSTELLLTDRDSAWTDQFGVVHTTRVASFDTVGFAYVSARGLDDSGHPTGRETPVFFFSRSPNIDVNDTSTYFLLQHATISSNPLAVPRATTVAARLNPGDTIYFSATALPICWAWAGPINRNQNNFRWSVNPPAQFFVIPKPK